MTDYKRDVPINYDVVEVIHKSSTWGNLVIKVKYKDNLYVLKCFPKIDTGLQKTIFYREMEALKELNSCEGIVKLRHVDKEIHPFGKESYGGS